MPISSGRVVAAGEPQDRHCRVQFPHEGRELISTEAGHPAIRNDQIETVLFDEFPGLEAIRGFDHVVFFEAEGAGHDGTDGDFVIYKENAVGHARLSGRRGMISAPVSLSCGRTTRV